MTNKSPVVGKIYKTKKEKVYVGHKDSEVLGVNKGLVWYFQDPKIFSKCEEYYHYEIVTIDRFWRTHEELAEDSLQKTTHLTAVTNTTAITETDAVMLEIEIGSEWQSIDGKVVTIDFVKNKLVVWTYEFNDREQITFSTKKEFFIKDFKEIKKKLIS